MINVAICTPSIGVMRTRYTTSLFRMLLHYQKHPVLGREEEPRFLSYHVIEGSMVGAARETMVDDILQMPNTTHLLFIDEDMGFRQDCLNRMLARQVPFVSANYRMKIPPCYFTARKADDSSWLETKKEPLEVKVVLYKSKRNRISVAFLSLATWGVPNVILYVLLFIPSAYNVPSSCRYQELKFVPVMLAESALRVTVAVVVGM